MVIYSLYNLALIVVYKYIQNLFVYFLVNIGNPLLFICKGGNLKNPFFLIVIKFQIQ